MYKYISDLHGSPGIVTTVLFKEKIQQMDLL